MSFSPAFQKQREFKHIKDAIANVGFPSRKPVLREFRTSSFPYCPILDLIHYFEARATGTIPTAYRQQFYFTIGHAIHDLWQTAMIGSPKYGSRVYGNWHCPGPDCSVKRLNTLKPAKSPCCGENWEYHEIAYLYRGLTGHSDLITRNNRNSYTIWELKTVPYWFLQSYKLCSEYQMYQKSLTQTRIYAALARKIYQLPITRIVIVNLGRESPNLEDIKLNALDFTDRDYQKIMSRLDRSVAARKSVTKLLKEQKRTKPPKKLLQKMLDQRPCHTRSDYYRKMDQRWFGKDKCPVYKLGVCTKDPSGQQLPALIKEMWKVGTLK